MYLETKGFKKGGRQIVEPHCYRNRFETKPLFEGLRKMFASGEISTMDLVRIASTFRYKTVRFRDLTRDAKLAVLQDRFFETELCGDPVVMYMNDQRLCDII